ncbi:ATP-binding protein [Azonexus fungiphilus]|uniref:ATP-binding protein n=1 Tax=Azonexus fungiphilus TaxID=146940 RepID=UPI00156B4B8E|nr:ATP-binding protein [Azonexus fungiphilus]NHC05447.1 HAMP domain-containing histidine kinase [Azonexus fungiphilus]
MPFIVPTADSKEYLLNLRRLFGLRWAMLVLMALLVLIVPGLLGIALPQSVMLAILAIGTLLNALGHWSAGRQRTATANELCSQLIIDIATLSALIFFSGGATNPLVSLLLPPVAIAALGLPRRQVIVVGASAVAAYSLLMLFYLPLPIADASRATQLHLVGMWLTFAVSALLIGWVILRMSQAIRRRDAELAAAREQALRDERVTAMGTLAAGAAHELGTPLATMALLAGELAQDQRLPADARDDIELLRRQIAACKEIITGLSRRAGAERLENARFQPVDRWLDALRQKWHALRPQPGSRLVVASDGEAPGIVADPRLEQALLNLLNNAANACPQPLEVRLAWHSRDIEIEIRDRGPGFPAEVIALCGKDKLPAHDGGCGVGLLLTCSAIGQLGGRLSLENPESGGALARISLPIEKP